MTLHGLQVLDCTGERGEDTFPGPSGQALLGLQLNSQLVQASSGPSTRAARVTVVEVGEQANRRTHTASRIALEHRHAACSHVILLK